MQRSYVITSIGRTAYAYTETKIATFKASLHQRWAQSRRAKH